MPAYIGWSPKEGSGVFDPVEELGLSCSFYRMNERLEIDLEDLEKRLKLGNVGVFVVIHYFGYVDPGYEAAVALAKRHGAFVLEDEAHSMYTDLVGGASGRLGDACIFSLHKMLPVSSGGLLVINPGRRVPRLGSDPTAAPPQDLWSFDLLSIAMARRRNAELLSELIAESAHENLTPLRANPPAGVVPQTLPVLVRGVSRDQLYHLLNQNGFGVVSLYHTMISAISPETFPESFWLSRHILNLPVHQDVSSSDLQDMLHRLNWCVDKLKCSSRTN